MKASRENFLNKDFRNHNNPYVFKRNYDDPIKLPDKQISDIIKITIAGHFGVSSDAVEQRGRRKEHVIIRQLATYFIYIHCPHMSLAGIGAIVGGDQPFDHVTIKSTLKRMSDLMETDENHLKLINELSAKVKRDLENFEGAANDINSYYMLDMNKFSVMDIKYGKAIVFVGLEESEIRKLMAYPDDFKLKLRKIKNTGFKVIKKLAEPDDEKKEDKISNYEKTK